MWCAVIQLWYFVYFGFILPRKLGDMLTCSCATRIHKGSFELTHCLRKWECKNLLSEFFTDKEITDVKSAAYVGDKM